MAISNPLKNQEIHTAGNTNKPPFSLYTEKKKKNSIKPSLWNIIRVLKRKYKISHSVLKEKSRASPFLACPARITDLELGENKLKTLLTAVRDQGKLFHTLCWGLHTQTTS